MRLIDDWKKASKWWSVRIAAFGFIASSLGAAIAATGAVVPWFSILKPWEGFTLGAIVFLGVLVGRIIKQKDKDAQK